MVEYPTHTTISSNINKPYVQDNIPTNFNNDINCVFEKKVDGSTEYYNISGPSIITNYIDNISRNKSITLHTSQEPTVITTPKPDHVLVFSILLLILAMSFCFYYFLAETKKAKGYAFVCYMLTLVTIIFLLIISNFRITLFVENFNEVLYGISKNLYIFFLGVLLFIEVVKKIFYIF